MARAKIVKIDLGDAAEDVLEALKKARIIVTLMGKDDTCMFVAARGVNLAALKKEAKKQSEE